LLLVDFIINEKTATSLPNIGIAVAFFVTVSPTSVPKLELGDKLSLLVFLATSI
jgi:hypothetical protein